MNGIININKPKGITSSAVVGKVRRILHQRKVGHMGTLDPMGTGVLPIGVGKGTRLFDYFLLKDKQYYAEFRFGLLTDTLDSEGSVLREGGAVPTLEQIAAVVPALVGEVDQLPPLFSAKCVDGERAYLRARRGEEFELSPKRVRIDSIQLVGQLQGDVFGFVIDCSGGTYIRSIARDMGEALNTCAIMTAIERRRAGRFLLQDAVTLEQLESAGETALIPVCDAIDLPVLVLPDSCYKPLSCGVKQQTREPDGSYKLFCRGEFWGICRVERSVVAITSYMREE